MGSTVIRDGTIEFVNYYANGNVSSRYKHSHPRRVDEQYVVFKFMTDGIILDETQYINGIKEGYSKRYGANGLLVYECIYLNDHLEGQYKKYNENGALQDVHLYGRGIRLH